MSREYWTWMVTYQKNVSTQTEIEPSDLFMMYHDIYRNANNSSERWTTPTFLCVMTNEKCQIQGFYKDITSPSHTTSTLHKHKGYVSIELRSGGPG